MRRYLIGGILIAMVVVGCSTTGRVDGVVLTSPNTPLKGDAMGAIVAGTLRFDESRGCLLLQSDSAAFPIVWPGGASWLEDPPRVRLRDGVIAEPGMWISGGGGYLQRDNVEHVAGSEVADAAADCAGPTGEIAVFNLSSNVTVIAVPPGGE